MPVYTVLYVSSILVLETLLTPSTFSPQLLTPSQPSPKIPLNLLRQKIPVSTVLYALGILALPSLLNPAPFFSHLLVPPPPHILLPNGLHSADQRSNARPDWFCWKLFDNLNLLHFSTSDQFSKCPLHSDEVWHYLDRLNFLGLTQL